ncbi:MAG: efflux RND transporter periplasmic adaptor subunit [Desulfobacterales bacterium]|jgi:membrane fusion protein (multidrug efflux system)
MQTKRLALFLAVLLWAGFLAFGCDDKTGHANTDDEANPPSEVPVSIIEIQAESIRDIIFLPATTEAWQDVKVAADTAGRIEWIGPREGDLVKKGDLLIKIDVSALKAALDHARAQYQLADELYQRRQRLYERKIIALEELDQSKTQRTLAATDLRQIKVRYNHGFPRSPINGIINHLYVDAGEFIDTGKPIADIINIERIKINVRVPELDIRFVMQGQQTPVKIDAFPDRTLSGTVDFVAFKADPATKTFLVRTVIENPFADIRPGMIARVAFVRRVIPDALLAPLFAVVDKGGERLVFIEKDGVAQSRTVDIGVIEGDRVQITSGLNPGDHLIVRGQTEVEDGMRVRVQ